MGGLGIRDWEREGYRGGLGLGGLKQDMQSRSRKKKEKEGRVSMICIMFKGEKPMGRIFFFFSFFLFFFFSFGASRRVCTQQYYMCIKFDLHRKYCSRVQ